MRYLEIKMWLNSILNVPAVHDSVGEPHPLMCLAFPSGEWQPVKIQRLQLINYLIVFSLFWRHHTCLRFSLIDSQLGQ